MDAIANLVQFKGSGRGLVSIWKTDYELAGQYYAWYEAYVKFSIELIKASKDTSTFQFLLKKLRRSEESIVDFEPLWRSSLKSYIDVMISVII